MRRLWYLLNRRRIERELREDMEEHRAMMGTPRDFGNTLRLREAAQDVWGWAWLDHLIQDLRYAIYAFRRTPAFTMIVILTIALGVGATTAVFSVVDRILFRALPYTNENQLVSFGLLTMLDDYEFLPGDDFQEWKKDEAAFESITAYAITRSTDGGNCDLAGEVPVRLDCAAVETNFLQTFGVHPLIGRGFAEN